MSRLILATENGKRVGRTSKAKRLASEPATEAARLRRCLASIRAEAEKAWQRSQEQEAILRGCFEATASGNLILARAMAREALVEVPSADRFGLLVRYCEMAEEGTLCA